MTQAGVHAHGLPRWLEPLAWARPRLTRFAAVLGSSNLFSGGGRGSHSAAWRASRPLRPSEERTAGFRGTRPSCLSARSETDSVHDPHRLDVAARQRARDVDFPRRPVGATVDPDARRLTLPSGLAVVGRLHFKAADVVMKEMGSDSIAEAAIESDPHGVQGNRGLPDRTDPGIQVVPTILVLHALRLDVAAGQSRLMHVHGTASTSCDLHAEHLPNLLARFTPVGCVHREAARR